MAFFPNQIMPKSLRKETSREVDDSPLIYNARDYNIHHREIRAIQALLNGIPATPTATTTPALGGSTPTSTNGVKDLVNMGSDLLRLISDEGLFTHRTGTMKAGQSVPLPPNAISSRTSGTVLSSDVIITVEDTSGFPSTGFITKFNAVSSEELCTGTGIPPGAGSRCGPGSRKYRGLDLGGFSKITSQEHISYNGKTDTQFLGCTRGIDGTTVQHVPDNKPALIIAGRAALSLTHNFWGRRKGAPNEFFIAHDALLATRAAVLALGSRTRLREIQDLVELAYTLTVIGGFADVSVEEIFGLGT